MKALTWLGLYFLPRTSTQASPLAPATILYGTMPLSFCFIGSSYRRPIRRLIAKIVFSGLVIACRLAGCPTRISSRSVKATIEGVVRAPSAFSITFARFPSITATQELVVPRSIPITFVAFAMIGLLGTVPFASGASDEPRCYGRAAALMSAQRLLGAGIENATSSACSLPDRDRTVPRTPGDGSRLDLMDIPIRILKRIIICNGPGSILRIERAESFFGPDGAQSTTDRQARSLPASILDPGDP